jgi:hypothetical protein
MMKSGYTPIIGTLYGLLLAAATVCCCQAQAQTLSDGSPGGQKPPEKSVLVPQELLKKALKNAKAIAPDETPRVAEVRPVPSKAASNPGQQKLLPSNSALPEASPDPKNATLPAGAKEPGSKVEKVEAPKPTEDPQPADEKTTDLSNGSIWEPTGITVSRLFLATTTAGGDMRKVPMSVPVLYESRLLAVDKDKQRAIARLLDKLVSYRSRLATMKKEGTDLLAEWNDIVGSSTPQDLLLSDSPTLIEKNDETTGHGTAPGFEPGKGVSVEVKSQ